MRWFAIFLLNSYLGSFLFFFCELSFVRPSSFFFSFPTLFYFYISPRRFFPRVYTQYLHVLFTVYICTLPFLQSPRPPFPSTHFPLSSAFPSPRSRRFPSHFLLCYLHVRFSSLSFHFPSSPHGFASSLLLVFLLPRRLVAIQTLACPAASPQAPPFAELSYPTLPRLSPSLFLLLNVSQVFFLSHEREGEYLNCIFSSLFGYLCVCSCLCSQAADG